jgi:tRNA A37 threonylcarbamoyladenosine modification protein TsaB
MLLALDTSTRTVGVAIYNGVSVLGETIWSSHDYHTVELAPKVAEMLLKL